MVGTIGIVLATSAGEELERRIINTARRVVPSLSGLYGRYNPGLTG
jgi:hypothetical protein